MASRLAAASEAGSLVAPAGGAESGEPGCAHETAQVRNKVSKVVFTVVWGLSLVCWSKCLASGREWRVRSPASLAEYLIWRPVLKLWPQAPPWREPLAVTASFDSWPRA